MAAGEGRLDRPSEVADRARIPEELGRRFLVFVDTEEEFDWSKPFRRDATATNTVSALPDMQRRLADCGIEPTYLIDYPVADSPAAINVLRPLLEAGECAIGSQLHPWVNPPYDEALTMPNSFVGNLPEALERAKLRALTDRIAGNFGRAPTVYRAGRYGLGPKSARLLEEAGYRLDTSVRALFDYSAEGGPDYARHDHAAYWAGASRTLLELPLTALYRGRLRRWGRGLYPAAGRLRRMRGALARTGLLERIALTPEGTPLPDALRAIHSLLDDGERILTISFHSPSLVPGHTPYVRDAADLRAFHAWWDGVLDLLARERVAPIGVDAFVDGLWRARTPLATDRPDGVSEAPLGGL